MRISQKNVNGRRTEGAQCTSSHRTQKTHTSLNSNAFPKSSRILKRQHFKEIGSARNRYYGKFIVIDYCYAQEAKIGLTVVRQFGNAVERNRFKRLVREAFRQNRAELAPLEMIVMPQKGIEGYSLDLICKDLLEFTNVTQSRAAKSR